MATCVRKGPPASALRLKTLQLHPSFPLCSFNMSCTTAHDEIQDLHVSRICSHAPDVSRTQSHQGRYPNECCCARRLSTFKNVERSNGNQSEAAPIASFPSSIYRPRHTCHSEPGKRGDYRLATSGEAAVFLKMPSTW